MEGSGERRKDQLGEGEGVIVAPADLGHATSPSAGINQGRGAGVARAGELLTWCLNECGWAEPGWAELGRAEPGRKRRVFNSRCKVNQSRTETHRSKTTRRAKTLNLPRKDSKRSFPHSVLSARVRGQTLSPSSGTNVLCLHLVRTMGSTCLRSKLRVFGASPDS